MLAEVRAVSAPMLSDEFFLARQPILGRDQHLVAYELLFRAAGEHEDARLTDGCLLYTSPSPRDRQKSRMPSSA